MYPGAHVATQPNKPAVVMAESGDTVTFAELESQSVRIARYLHDAGLREGDHIALVSDNTARVFEVYWAALRSGLYITAVNRHLTPAEMAYIIDDCGARAVITSAALGDTATTVSDLVEGVDIRLTFGGTVPGFDDLDDAIVGLSDEPPADQPRGADMLYSSGTTGKPKGIEPSLPNRQIEEPGDTMATLASTIWSVDSDTVYLSPAPLYHAAPLRTAAAVQALGGTVVVMGKFDAERALSHIEKFAVTHSQWVPTMFVRMLKLPDEVRAKYDLSTLQVAIHAAAPCPVEVKRAMIEWWGPILVEYYSSTELAGLTSITSAEWLRKPGSVGQDGFLGNVRICGPDGQVLPPGEIGDVYFERDVMPFAYHNDPAKTKSAQHPQHENWSTTGDVGYLDADRYLFLTDRATFMIISGGVNIYPQEIENVLASHPSILDVAVIGVPDPEMGEQVLAVVQLLPGVESSDELAESILIVARDSLARYKVPRHVVFTSKLPRTPTGKLVKGELRGKYDNVVLG
ncbi:acyl-CoA synthetase [Rhodococcoides fascians]|uniref:acyl-CoA synthetase n=1 Tax=Rhodococcoides fascians TaxID=1828 RepID=UPI00056D67FD|nr:MULTISPECIES: acyl-CoA synthetase [Rhodococcus]OZF00890.1 acyl-CoA synthetase [Rhodococcus sp. 15-1189-1-1a]OZF14544.1 acyl-CoA synthetase [Rhodococcus sp. 14-2686-1-2]